MIKIYESELNKCIAEETTESKWIVWKQRSLFEMKGEYAYKCKFYDLFVSEMEFQNVLNNLKNSSTSRIIFMREKIKPNWEDLHHKNGGYFVINIDLNHQNYFNLIHDVMSLILKNKLIDSSDIRITGMSCINTINYKQLRIWISHKKFNYNCLSNNFKLILDLYKIDLEKSTAFKSFDELYLVHLNRINKFGSSKFT